MTEFCQKNAPVIANTLFQQHKRRLYTWTSPDGQDRFQIDYILCSQRWRSSIQSAKTSLGADCGSDHELLIAKFRLKLKEVEKTTRPFRYDLKSNPLTSLVAQMVKHLPAMLEMWVQSLGGKDLLEKEMATYSSTLAWKISWTEELGSQSLGLQRVRHDSVTSLSL